MHKLQALWIQTSRLCCSGWNKPWNWVSTETKKWLHSPTTVMLSGFRNTSIGPSQVNSDPRQKLRSTLPPRTLVPTVPGTLLCHGLRGDLDIPSELDAGSIRNRLTFHPSVCSRTLLWRTSPFLGTETFSHILKILQLQNKGINDSNYFEKQKCLDVIKHRPLI